MNGNKKIAIVGTGFVGMSYAFALLNQSICNELVLIDINKQRAEGEAMDLNHGLAFAASSIKIYAGDYYDCADADIVTVCAGVSQKPGEDRISLLKRNKQVFDSIIKSVVGSGFSGIFLIATNPVDIMTRITADISGFDCRRVIGTGTTLDTARLRYLLGSYFDVDPRNVHAYVMGEHGDSEFVPWSQAMLATKPILSICEQKDSCSFSELEKIRDDVKNAAQQIIAAKNSTYYGIGMSLVRITKAIFGNESSVLTVSARLRGEYGRYDVYAGVPCIIGRNGIRSVLELELSESEFAQMDKSCDLLQSTYDSLLKA